MFMFLSAAMLSSVCSIESAQHWGNHGQQVKRAIDQNNFEL